MLFNSIHFLFFFIIVTTVYFMMPHRLRWGWLLAASCYFYMAFVPVYILILGFTIVIDYFAGLFIEKAEGKRRKVFLVVSLVANIGVLAVFKYYNFFNDLLTGIMQQAGYQNQVPYLSILLPIGLSFHTFQAMSYTIEVYRGNQKAERHFGVYSLYVMFYPQLVAGPIERPQNLLHQFHERHSFDYRRLVEGLKLMLWGLFMKLVVADRLAIYVDAVYDNYELHSGKTLAVATAFFAIQIYCDFAGYSNIAIGAARVMGFKLMTNFNSPYFSKSVSEFWKRWHISLSTWFKDYLYLSLGGNKVSIPRWYFNLFLVFLISGFWHGANWTFITWGALNGFYLIFAIATRDARTKIWKRSGITRFHGINNFIQILLTFILICLTWVFFRSETNNKALQIIGSILTLDGKFFIMSRPVFVYSLFAVIALFIFDQIILKRRDHSDTFGFSNSWMKEQLICGGMIVCILTFGVLNGGQFIYFQF